MLLCICSNLKVVKKPKIWLPCQISYMLVLNLDAKLTPTDTSLAKTEFLNLLTVEKMYTDVGQHRDTFALGELRCDSFHCLNWLLQFPTIDNKCHKCYGHSILHKNMIINFIMDLISFVDNHILVQDIFFLVYSVYMGFPQMSMKLFILQKKTFIFFFILLSSVLVFQPIQGEWKIKWRWGLNKYNTDYHPIYHISWVDLIQSYL